jgi:hypothetical protein
VVYGVGRDRGKDEEEEEDEDEDEDEEENVRVGRVEEIGLLDDGDVELPWPDKAEKFRGGGR